MAEVTYKCPKCSATLKPGKPIPAGKKIKCPKCETVFAPDGESSPAKPGAANPAGVAKPRFDEDEDSGGTYGIKDEPPPPESELSLPPDDEDDEGKPRKKKKKVEKSDLQDELLKRTGPRTKRGAAQAICQKPSNQLLATSSFACASCIFTAMYALWPIFFSPVKRTEVELVFSDKFPVWLLLVLTVGAFVYNGVIAIGSVKLQSIESYTWALAACMLSIIPVSGVMAIFAFTWFLKFVDALLGVDNMITMATIFILFVWYIYVGVWNLMTLRKPEVVAGFAEKKPLEV
jgi:hypothetical protein